MNLTKYFLLPVLLAGFAANAQQIEAGLQLRPRFEYRDGYKAMLEEDQDPTSFISQRSRLSLSFANEKLQVKVRAQNIRVWGDVPTTATADKNGVMLFEAWGQYPLSPAWAIKVGRQVISLDNQRIMGEIDWAQQGQSHDAAVLRFSKSVNLVHAGAALNSDAENLAKVPYTVNNYKAMQFIHYKTAAGKFDLSFLLLNTGYEYANPDETAKTDYSQTFGSYITYRNNRFSANAAAYGQTGKRNDAQVKAWYGGINAAYKLKGNWEIKGGLEVLSGKDQNNTGTAMESFNPLFGTNHAFNGLMDYFYVGNHQNSVGLQDAFLALNYTRNGLSIELTPHLFWSQADIYRDTQKLDAFLGSEIDLTAKYALGQDIILYAGYSVFADTESLKAVKNSNGNSYNNWAWLMISMDLDLYKSR